MTRHQADHKYVPKAAWRGVILAVAATVGYCIVGASVRWGAWCALAFGVGAALVLVARRPDGTPRSVADAVRSPWLLLGAGLAVAGGAPLVSVSLHGVEVLTSPLTYTMSCVSIGLVVAGLLALTRRRVPGQGFAVLAGECLLPLAVTFVAWAVALQLPRTTRLSAGAVTAVAVTVAGGLSAVAVSVFLRACDDDERPTFGLLSGVFGLLLAAGGLHAAQVGFGGRVDARWTVACTVAAMGLWLATSVHPAAGAAMPGHPVHSVTISHRRRLLIPAIMLLGGPALIIEYARQGAIRSPMWIAGGASALLVLVTAYLLSLANRAGHLERLAHRDALTGLANRSLFIDRLGLALARARRNRTGVAVLFVDLDRFKIINDSLGHAAGDEVLGAAARRLVKVVGDAGFVGRIGGDEFTVFLPDLPRDADVGPLCTALVRAFDGPFVVHRDEVFVTVSVGVARSPDAGWDAETLVRNADAAMYKAKRRGKDTFELYRPEINSKARDHLSLESGLHSAIGRDELRLFYQPKVALSNGSIVGVEALIRWAHPERGMLSPGDFIPLAEQSDLIVRLDAWALEEACIQAVRWQRSGFGALAVAVNLSARDFHHGHVEDMVASILRRTGLDPASLELELTETLAQEDPDRTRATLLDLKGMGVHCSIDDFGTGYSSLSALAGLPIDRVKINKSFVQHIADGRQYALITGIISLAHGLDMTITAEGVETVQQLEFLEAHGCDVMQGYLFSRPLAAEDLEQTLMLENFAHAPSRLQLVSGIWTARAQLARDNHGPTAATLGETAVPPELFGPGRGSLAVPSRPSRQQSEARPRR